MSHQRTLGGDPITRLRDAAAQAESALADLERSGECPSGFFKRLENCVSQVGEILDRIAPRTRSATSTTGIPSPRSYDPVPSPAPSFAPAFAPAAAPAYAGSRSSGRLSEQRRRELLNCTPLGRQALAAKAAPNGASFGVFKLDAKGRPIVT